MAEASVTALRVPKNPLLTRANNIDFHWKTIDEAFPGVDPEMEPFGVNVIVQIRHAPSESSGGITLSGEDRANIYYNEQVGKVVAMGPMCFQDVVRLEDGTKVVEDWAGGPWFKVGDYVWIPKYGGVRFTRGFEVMRPMIGPGGALRPQLVTEDQLFAAYKCKDIIGKIPGDPRRLRTFID